MKVNRLLILVFGTTLVAGVGFAATNKNPPAATKKGAPAQPALLPPGGKVVHDDFEIAVLGARRPTDWVRTPPPGKGYVVLRFRVKNVGRENVRGDVSRSLQWKDPADGMRRGTESSTGVKLNNPDNAKLAPGSEAVFEAVYLAPTAATSLEFHYIAGYGPIEKARWRVKVE